jgi:hypothetical protein
VEGGVGGLTASGVSRNRGSFVRCVAIQKRLGIPALDQQGYNGKVTQFMESKNISETLKDPTEKYQLLCFI